MFCRFVYQVSFPELLVYNLLIGVSFSIVE